MAKSIISFLLVILIIAGLVLTAMYGVTIGDFQIPSVLDEENGIRRGLDLVGGSSITYEAQIEGDVSAEELESGMDACVAMLRQRATALGYTEATVARSGDKRIVVEIPSISDPEEAVQKLGTTAQLEFVDADGNVVMTGTDIAKAQASYQQISQLGGQEHCVTLKLTDEAVEKFATATREAAARTDGKNYISIQLDGQNISQPYVDSEINSDSCVISGNFTADSAKWLANLISSGQMPFTLREVQLSSVGPTLGEKALETSLFAGAIGLALVMVFMLIFYRLPGLVACISLTGYTALVAVILALLKVNLSLPGIAGIILGIGMAVDANIVIFERIKEELRNGSTMVATAIRKGFSRAFTAIIDSNVTTIIAAVVLKFLGTGPIVGFANTLLVSVVVSMFTAIVVSRFLLNSLVGMNIKNVKAYGA